MAFDPAGFLTEFTFDFVIVGKTDLDLIPDKLRGWGLFVIVQNEIDRISDGTERMGRS